MSHDVFTGSAGAPRCTTAGWTHTVDDDARHGGPDRRVVARAQHDPAFPWVWLLITTACLTILAALSRPALAGVLWLLGIHP